MVRMEIGSGPRVLLFILNKWVCGCSMCRKKWLVQTVPKYNIRETRSNGDIKCINHMHKLCIFSMKQCCIQVTVMLLKKKKKKEKCCMDP